MYRSRNKYKNSKSNQIVSPETDLDLQLNNKPLRRNNSRYFEQHMDEAENDDFVEDESLEDINEVGEYEDLENDSEDVVDNNLESSDQPLASTSDQSVKLPNIKGAVNKGKSAVNAIKKLKKAPIPTKYKLIIVLAIIILCLCLLLFLVSLGMLDDESSEGIGGNNQGYYDLACNFNKTKVDYQENNITYEDVTLDDFIKGVTYAYVKDANYSKETLKTLIIILKTNALSLGKYSNLFQKLDLSDFANGYVDSANITDKSLYSKIETIYESVSNELFVLGTYTGTIKSLSDDDVLPLDNDILIEIENLQNTKEYEEILNELYNSNGENKKLYKISDNCTYYTLTENDEFWWPIGSSSSTEGNIYGGTPTSTNITSKFGYRTVEGRRSYHNGIDIGAPCATNVVIASKAGSVQKVVTGCDNSGGYGNNCGGGYGNYIIIDHTDGTSTVYAHLYPNSITLKIGDRVKQGEKIGLVGNSGSSTGCHLHFEVRVSGNKVDPLNHVSVDNPRPVKANELISVNDSVSSASETKKEICESLKRSGYSDNAIAGMLVNIEAEGSFLVNNLEGCYEENQCCYDGTYGFCMHPEIAGFGSDEAYTKGIDSGAYPREKFVNDRAGYGLIQWTSSNRKANLYDTAKSQKKSIGSLSVQLGYLLEEVKNPYYAITYKYITGNYSAYEVATNFCLDFESPRNESSVCPNRASSNSQKMLNYVKNNCS